MSKVIDLDLYRDAHMIVESETLPGFKGVIRWTITGEKRHLVGKAVDKLQSVAFRSVFEPIELINDTADPRCGWYRAEGYTAEDITIIGGKT